MLLKDLIKGTKKFKGDRLVSSNPEEVKNLSTIVVDKTQLQIKAQVDSSRSGSYDCKMYFILDTKALKFKVEKGKYDLDTSKIKVGCSCPDYTYTFAFANEQKNCNLIKIESYTKKTDRASRNESKEVGMCKHLMGVYKKLLKDNVIIPV